MRFSGLVKDVPCLRYPCEHSRPVGYMFYAALYPAAKLSYQWWAWAMLALGLANVALLWRLLEALEFDPVSAALGCLVFTASRALFDGWWKPMFIYDVLATTFALIMLLAYIRGRWVVSFIAFFLAMRTKEIAIALPAVLLCYEFTLGRREWKRLIVFFIPATIYAFYGILMSSHSPRTPYTITLTPAGLWRSMLFYSSNVFGIPYAGLLIPLTLLVTRDRRLLFALGAGFAAIGVYLLLPGRMLEVYLYLAMPLVAIVIATLATHHRQTVALLAMVWAGWQFVLIREHAAVTREDASERRAYAAALRRVPKAPAYLYIDAPESFGYFGGEYAIRVITGAGDVYRLDAPFPADKPLPVLTWIASRRILDLSTFVASEAGYHARGHGAVAWQGTWPIDDEGYRSVNGFTIIRLYRPGSAAEFEFEACGPAGFALNSAVADVPLPAVTFDMAGCLTRQFPLPPGPAGLAIIAFNNSSSDKVARIGAFGFR